ncbi:HNH endonuclease signature motif containing protein [Microbispora sp. H10885]|uniref:HNH endonuclease signature motif containing protein n=1 Tax=Microbispora sp. H10885 TaxID=2729110 RepID=UPI0016011D52|nr:HNH endonuclease signature motif containing protein [Microbispora sp. H10885]
MGSSSWVAVAAVGEAARAVALVPVPESAEVCLAEAEELLAARDRITSALAARVGRVHRAGEARNHGHASTRLWLRSVGGMTIPGAGRLVTMGMELGRLSRVRERFAEGSLAEGIVEAICTATAGLTDEQATTAEGILLELAGSAGAAEVAKAGRYLRAVLDPDGHESDEQADFDRRFFRVRRRRNGGLEGEFYLPVEAAARMQHLLDVYARPKAEGDDRTPSVRNADAVIAFLENKIATELLVLVNAESLPDDPPADNPGADNPAGTTPSADSTADPSADHPTSDPSDADPSDGPGPDSSGTGPGPDPDPWGTDPGPEPGSGDDPVPGPDDCTAEEFGSDACATHPDATSATGEPTIQAPAEPGAGANTSPGAESAAPPWTGGGAWAGVGGSAPPGVWLRGLPGLILATGHLLPVSSVHRLARTSTLVRIVMDAGGQVLDMGRKVRLATPAQRRAVFARYATCWVDGCPLPATMCQIDHAEDWCSGGLTDLTLLGPACQFHNRDRYRHPTRYTRRKIGADRWAFTYRNPHTTRLRV